MLVLTRKSKESIEIGENVTVTILAVEGNKVRVGITAPRSVNIVRTEISNTTGRQCVVSTRDA